MPASAIAKLKNTPQLVEAREQNALLGCIVLPGAGAGDRAVERAERLLALVEPLARDAQLAARLRWAQVDVTACAGVARALLETDPKNVALPCVVFLRNGQRVEQLMPDYSDKIGGGPDPVDELMRRVRASTERLTRRVLRVASVSELDVVKAVNKLIVLYFFGQWDSDPSLERTLESFVEEMEHLDNAEARRERELRQRAAVLKQRPPDVRRPPPVKFCKVDVNECEELAVEFRIPAVPAFVLIKNGIQVDSLVAGSPDKEMFANTVRFLREC
jgi:hypothetical protein